MDGGAVGLNNFTGSANMLFFMSQEITASLTLSLSPTFSLSSVFPLPPFPSAQKRKKKKGFMENNKLSRGHINLDVNRWAIMF